MVDTGNKLKRCLVVVALVLPIAGFAKEDANGALAQCKAEPELNQARGHAVTTFLIKCMGDKGFVFDVNLPIMKGHKCSESIFPEVSAECYRRTAP